jgi:hypothetical protein
MVKKLYSRKRRSHSRQHRKSMKGGGWFSDMFVSSSDPEKKEGEMIEPATAEAPVQNMPGGQGDPAAPAPAAPEGPGFLANLLGTGKNALAATQGQLGNMDNKLKEVNAGVMAKFDEGKGALANQIGNLSGSIKNMLPTGAAAAPAAAAPAAGGAHQKGGKRRRSRHSKRVSRHMHSRRHIGGKKSKKHGKRSNKKTKRVRFSLRK